MGNSIVSQRKTYHHLTQIEREYIACGYYAGKTCSTIAGNLERNKSTISRELKRNRYINAKKHYSPSYAQRQYQKRLSKAHQRYRLKDKVIQDYVLTYLKIGWSPEIIAGKLSFDHPGLTTNYESIYQFIYDKRRHWIKYLPRGHKKRRNRSSTKGKRSLIPNRVSIDDRPDYINNRSEVGHWEADTMVSRQSRPVLQVIVERKTRFIKIAKLPNNRAAEMRKRIIAKLVALPKGFVKSITYDNGLENREHELVNRHFQSKSYFCHAYHSWGKGSVEQANGLIRRFYPKKTDFSKLSRYDIKEVEKLLNDRPRKCLGFKTPRETLTVALNS